MFPFHSKPELRPTFEKMFFEHYSRLLEWALQFTRGDRSEAEDLVQELYVRFAKLSTTSEHIENSGNYLFSVLRNLHYVRVRRGKTTKPRVQWKAHGSTGRLRDRDLELSYGYPKRVEITLMDSKHRPLLKPIVLEISEAPGELSVAAV